MADRKRLSDERKSITQRFRIAGAKGYITVGLYKDGTPGEIFITMSKEGSTMSGLLDTIAVQMSLLLQNDVPLKSLVAKFANTNFEPSGMTDHECIPEAKSIMDFIVRWMGLKFIRLDELQEIGVVVKCGGCLKRDDSGYSCLAKTMIP